MLTLAPWMLAPLLLLLAGAWWAGRRSGSSARPCALKPSRCACSLERAYADAAPLTPDDVTIEGEAEAPDAYAPAPSLDDAAHARFVVLRSGGLVLRLVDGEGHVLKEYEWGPARAWLLWRAYARTRRRLMGASSEGEETS